jgi:hypothetical protein
VRETRFVCVCTCMMYVCYSADVSDEDVVKGYVESVDTSA